MRLLYLRLRASALGAAGALLLCACAVTGLGVGYDAGYDGGYDGAYDAGYYAPYGYDYGGWGVGYAVGPWCCGHRDERRDHPDRGRGGRRPAYRPAPAGRAAPSIPGRRRAH